MADENHTSTPRPIRKSVRDPELTLGEAIEEERSWLMKAESVLSCSLLAMEKYDCRSDGVYFPTAVELARDLLRQSIDRLDSVYIAPRIEKLRSQQKSAHGDESGAESGVREVRAIYLARIA